MSISSVLVLILLQKFLPLPPTLKRPCLAEPHAPFTCYQLIMIKYFLYVLIFESKDSAGYDEISSTIAKSTMQCIISPLTDIINCSFKTGIIPNDIKIAKVIPVYKSGPKDVFSNYRPISVLPFFSKIFEKLAYNRLLNHIKKHAILNPNHYGFRKIIQLIWH